MAVPGSAPNRAWGKRTRQFRTDRLLERAGPEDTVWCLAFVVYFAGGDMKMTIIVCNCHIWTASKARVPDHPFRELHVSLITDSCFGSRDEVYDRFGAFRRQRSVVGHLRCCSAFIVHAYHGDDPSVTAMPMLAVAQKIAEQPLEIAATLDLDDHCRSACSKPSMADDRRGVTRASVSSSRFNRVAIKLGSSFLTRALCSSAMKTGSMRSSHSTLFFRLARVSRRP